jgi:tetratricopeptide (TPR) repeat protein
MPASSTDCRSLSPRAKGAGRWLLAILCFGLLSQGVGCRAFRCQQVSDEAIAAARQLSLQGLDAQQRGRWDHAESLFAQAIITCPHDERARCGYAQSLWQRGARDIAVTHMEEAVRLSGHDPERLVQLGHMYREQGDLERAGRQAARAIAANGQLASAWALRGEVERAQGERAAALTSFHRALSLQPHFAPVQLAVADIYASENRPQRALATLQALTSTFPAGQAPVELLVKESQVLVSLGRYPDAARTLASAVERGNPSAELLLELARAQAQSGEIAAARLSLGAALARDPQHPGCLALARELGSQPDVAAATLPLEPSSMH